MLEGYSFLIYIYTAIMIIGLCSCAIFVIIIVFKAIGRLKRNLLYVDNVLQSHRENQITAAKEWTDQIKQLNESMFLLGSTVKNIIDYNEGKTSPCEDTIILTDDNQEEDQGQEDPPFMEEIKIGDLWEGRIKNVK